MKPITISHLYKSYQDKKVLTDFSATLEPGRITALMAPSGGGKTTLLRILCGLEAPDSGEIQGLEQARISPVFQEDRLCLYLDPVANLRLVNPALSSREAEDALRAVGLSDCLHQKTRELSGGMRRRVAILRALLCPADLIVLDEPFRGLDQETKLRVMEDTRRRCQGHTVLLVTHDETELAPMGVETCLRL